MYFEKMLPFCYLEFSIRPLFLRHIHEKSLKDSNKSSKKKKMMKLLSYYQSHLGRRTKPKTPTRTSFCNEDLLKSYIKCLASLDKNSRAGVFGLVADARHRQKKLSIILVFYDFFINLHPYEPF